LADSTERKFSRMTMADNEVEAFNGSVQQLLEAQVADMIGALERAVALNKTIAQRLSEERLSHRARLGISYSASSPALWSTEGADSEPDVSTTELAFSQVVTNEIDAKVDVTLEVRKVPGATPRRFRPRPSAKQNSPDQSDRTRPSAKQSSPDLSDRTRPSAKQNSPDLSEPLLPQSNKHDIFSRMQSRMLVKSEASVYNPLLPSVAELKRRVSQTMSRPMYHVEDFYHAEGFCQSVARNLSFIQLTFIVIISNTLWMAIDTDNNKAAILCNAPPVYQIADNLFCAFFSFEIIVRFLAFRRKCEAFHDTMFVLDMFLVSLMAWETWIQVALYLSMGGSSPTPGMRGASVFRVFRILRLMRVARVARLFRSMPEMMILVNGMIMACRSVFVSLCMMSLIIYIFAIMFTQMLSGLPATGGAFDSVPKTFNFLLMQALCGLQSSSFDTMLAAGLFYYLMFLMYCLLACTTIMNMLIGILVEVVGDVAEVEKETAFMRDVEFQINRMMEKLDIDRSDSLTQMEFDKLTETPEVIQGLQDLGVDVVAFVDFADFVFCQNCEELSYTDFLEMVVQFRGTKSATVKDIVDMRKFVSMELSSLEDRLSGTEK